MIITKADSLQAVDTLSTSRELVVRDSKKLARVFDLPSLDALTVVGCPALRDVSWLKVLKHLRLVDRDLRRLPDWLAPHGSVPQTTLTVVGGEELLWRLVPGGEDCE
ncbi:hypothetical protein BAE44_0019226 [Dichanthelium oligosanthes]|uniref:Uncharacterized protein n=1 Tax=Dichanthelium oligosanthes TaxID=888268 RepID=A0A1E5V3M0_9POAL|nr:hypothetical protein BAE44_0019226 [Dichanthelium oligosanthes]